MCIVDSEQKDDDQGPIEAPSQSFNYDALDKSQHERGSRLWNETYRANQSKRLRLDAPGPTSCPSSANNCGTSDVLQAAKPAPSFKAPRVYPCRYDGCGKVLSSSSNRSRHEHNQHKSKGEQRSDVLTVQEMSDSSSTVTCPPRISTPVRMIIEHKMRAFKLKRDPKTGMSPHITAKVAPISMCPGSDSVQSESMNTDSEESKVSDTSLHFSASQAEADPQVLDMYQTTAATLSESAPESDESQYRSEGAIRDLSRSEAETKEDGEKSHDIIIASDHRHDDVGPEDKSGDHDHDVHAADSEQDLMAESDANCESLRGLVRPLMQESDLHQSFGAFLTWLSQPPITSVEALVKARRITSDSQLQPIKLNLRFMFGLLYERELIDVAAIAPEALTKIGNCRALYEALLERGAGSSRIHVLFLLIKKVLVFLSSQESVKRGVFTLPSSIESYMYVENIGTEHGARRKQETRNRAVLGAATSHQLQKQLHHLKAPPPSRPMIVNHLPATAFKAEVSVLASANPLPLSHIAADLSNESDANSSNSLGKDELRQVSQGCLAFLNDAIGLGATPTRPLLSSASADIASAAAAADGLFISYLITATLCFGLAPRSQVLKQLQIGTSLVKNAADGKYWVRMLAEQSKNGKPTAFALPLQMTRPYDHYLTVVRPRVLGRLAQYDAHAYVFFKRNGTAPRSDFSSHTNIVTLRILGRPVNAHAFRAAVITAYYETGASQTQMNTLADIMAHDPETARNFYYRPQFARASVETNDAMVNFLL